MPKDSRHALDQLSLRDDVRGTPLLLWGLSMGGQVAIELARLNEDKLDGLITEGAVTSFRHVASDYSPGFMRPLLWLVVKGPYTGSDAIAAIDGLPKLIIQSQADTEVPRARVGAVRRGEDAQDVVGSAGYAPGRDDAAACGICAPC